MLSKGFGWRLFMSIVVIAASAYLGNTQPRLGLDLRGGTQIVYEAQDTETVTVDSQVVQRTVEVLRRRVDAMGTVEPNIQASGDRRIIVELPDVSDPQEAIEVIGQTAQLTFHPVLDTVAQGEEAPEGGTVVDDEDGLPIVIGPARLTGEDVKDAIPLFETSGTISGVWVVQVNFQSEGEQKWADLTREAACESFGSPKRRIAILLDDQVITSPQVSTNVPCATGITGGTTIITGNFDEESAADLALLIQAGALPVPIEIVEQGTIGPTLGETAIAASIEAALIGAGLTLLYMIAYYRLLGVTAAISLIVYALLSAGVLLWFGATITLPGIAGFVLAVGMAVDANVLIFERIKDELRAGKRMRAALRSGFQRAFVAIFDANLTTLIAVAALYYFGTGPVRGFAVTLGLGILASMFTAVVITRWLLGLAIDLNPKRAENYFGVREAAS